MQVSNLIVDCPEIQRLDIHPLLASGSEFTALDVTLDIAPFEGDNESRLAVRPYPHQLEEWVELKTVNAACSARFCQKMSHNFSNSFRESPKKIFITATLARSTNLPMKI